MDECYLKHLNMYAMCNGCTPEQQMQSSCYSTRVDVIQHLEHFNQMRLDMDNGDLEEQLAIARGEMDIW